MRHGRPRRETRLWGRHGGSRVARRKLTYPRAGAGSMPTLQSRADQEMSGAGRDARLPIGRVHDVFAARAAAQPDAIAVSGPDETLTYGQLERRANRLAHRLHTLEIDRDRTVGLCVERSAALIVGALGILKAGCAYVAMDPSHPPERLGFMLRDSCASALITSDSVAAQVDTAGAAVIALDAAHTELDLEPTAALGPGKASGDLAYVIYTSGSTGAPKGVLVEHASLRNLVLWHHRAFEVTEADRATQIASPAFDASVWEIWPYLTAGASIHVPTDEVRVDPVALRDWLVAERISVSFLPTALAEAVLSLDWPQGSPLRYLLTGGDALHSYPRPSLPFALVNNYGPTEATVVATSGVVRPSATPSCAPSIGKPIANARVYLVDDEMRPVANGTPGELLIGGDGVARGYLNRPEMTDEKFIPDRFGGTPGARLYRTGDLARRRPNGEIEFLGRLDEQVKIRGNRVELGEISATLNRHPGVRSSIVLVGDYGQSKPGLIAYVVPADSPPAAEQLRAHLAKQLPNYMLPAAFVWLEELPLTPNGKVDRAVLPAPGSATAAMPQGSARPRSELEQVLESIVAELLELDRVGIDENFFMIGGHSLLGAQLLVRIGDRFGVEMTLRSLFDHPTVAGISAEVERLIVADLEAMSDDDAARLLATGAPKPSSPPRGEHHPERR
jgi:amino acid adenylation domain-containing protein